MNRRHFVRVSGVFAVTASAGALAPMAVAASSPMGDLLSAPEQFIGRVFLSDNGSKITLDRVESVARDSSWKQWELHFSASHELQDGTYWLATTAGRPVQLYVQCHGRTARASVTRLA